MEENRDLTAERSIEIIRTTIEQNRTNISKDVGRSMYIAGLATMLLSVVVAFVNYFCVTSLGHLLWFALPIVIYYLIKNISSQYKSVPVNFVGRLIGKTWWTFAVITLSFFLFAIIWNLFLSRAETVDVYTVNRIRIAPVVVLLMGMTVAVTGHILKSKWLIGCGIIGGLLCFINESIGFVSMLFVIFGGASVDTVGMIEFALPCVTYFVFAFIGLFLPGLMLKK